MFCGHTHKARGYKHDGIAYYNTGAWTDFPLTYITIDAEGVRIREYDEADQRDPDETPIEIDAGADIFPVEIGSI